MARYRRFLDIDVLEAAQRRVSRIFDTHDTVAVCFSGGKDSQVVLNLVKDEAERRRQLPVHVIFRDEELIPQTVVDFVDKYRREPWVKMHWFTVPLASNRFILGSRVPYIQWDPSRGPDNWVRPKPPWGISLAPGDRRVMDQHSTDNFVVEHLPPGKVALCNGIRAAESLIRFRASVAKLNDNYINGSECKTASLCKPIYDWSEDDIFRFFYERGLDYCPVYDSQAWAGIGLRVATPLCAENAKRLPRLEETDPAFMDAVYRVFPEARVQSRYWGEVARDTAVFDYGQSFEGIARYIEEVMDDPGAQKAARDALKRVLKAARSRPQGFPPSYVFKWITNGALDKMLMALRADVGDQVRQRNARQMAKRETT
jgi:predicted phosphoadenosine phosphosulfate sulfurtransferase